MSKSRQKVKKTIDQELSEIREMDDFIKSQVENFQYKINCKFKNKKQKDLHRTILENRITFVRGSAGTGKAQPLDSKVLTPSGWKLMGDIKIGDEIITPDNKISFVSGIFPQGLKDIYEVEFSDGSKARCCDDHLWAVKDERLRNKRNKRGVKVDTEYSILPLKEIMGKITLPNRGRLNYSIPIVSEIEFSKKDIVDPYLMGILLGDGSFSQKHSVSFSTSDKEILEYLNYKLPEYNCKTSNIKIVGKTTNLNITGRKNVNYILNYIKSINLIGCKSNNKFIPNEYLLSTIEDRKNLLSGLLDSDGYIDSRTGTIYYYTISETLKNNVIELVNSLGGVCKETIKYPSYRHNGEKRIGQKCYILCLSINFNPFKLDRKRVKYKEKIKYKPIRYIKSVSYVGKLEAQCISIADDKHLYITDNYVVTHNTLISLMAGLDCLKDKTHNIGQIILTKPIVEISSQRGLGALPGDINEKTLAYYTHFYDNLTKLVGTYQTKFLKERGFIKETVLNYLRGSTFGKYTSDGESIGSFCIFDESQNCTVTEMKTFISRMGENSKLVILGDSDQIDLRLNKGEKCGLDDAIDRLSGIPGIGFIEFTEEDIVRDPFLVEIMKRYKK